MLLAALFGLLLGIFSGLMPGIGSASIILVFLPIFLSLDPMQAFVAYLAIVISSQYVASVTAIYLGIPGAESAVTTAREFGNIRKLCLTKTAIIQNATSSVLGNVIGLILFALILPYISAFASIYQNNIKVGILIMAYLVLIVTAERKYEAVVMTILGSFLMWIGYNPHTYQMNNFGLNFLSPGVPWVAVVLGSLIGSGVYSLRARIIPTMQANSRIIKSPYLLSATRGSVLGFFIGFVPGLSYILSSILTYLLEQRLLRDKTLKDKTLGSIAASEAAHSSGSVAMLVPLLVFAIPITASEAVILNIISIGSSLKDVMDEITNSLFQISAIILLINIVSFAIAMYCRTLVKWIFKIPLSYIRSILLLFGLSAVYFSNEYSLLAGVSFYFVFAYVFATRNLNPLPLVMAVLLFHTSQSTFYLFGDLL